MRGKHISKFITAVKRKGHRVALLGKKHAPDILVYGGIALGVAAGVMACKATLRADEVLDKHEDRMDRINTAFTHTKEDGEEYTERDKQVDTVKAYGQTAVDFVKLYAPSILMGTAAAASIVTGHGILKRRYAGAVAAYSAVATAFSAYRERVVQKDGKDKDLEYLGIKREEVAYTYTDADGNEAVGHEVVYTPEADIDTVGSPYSKIFDATNWNFNKDPELNRLFLDTTQKFANDRLCAQGHLFLNDVYHDLGFEPTKAGQVVGWIYDPKGGDDQVSFGLTRLRNARFINGFEYACLLDFNVDGPILDKVKLANT